MKYPSLNLSGNILSADIIEKLEQETLGRQTAKDFGLGKDQRLRDVIGSAWADANDYYRIFKRKIDQLAANKKGTSETRDLWLRPLCNLFGYQPEFSLSKEINNKNYDISFRDIQRDDFPLILISWNDSLDKRPERRSMSPHAEMQEYLNVSDQTYGIISNGRLIRLLRNSGRIARLSYVEFDLERIFEEGLYSDFALMFRLLHGSRMPAKQDLVKESVIEEYHLLSLTEGTRIREELSEAVKVCIKDFGKGFISNLANTDLRKAIDGKEISANQFYEELLRLIYRLLFLMVIEERGLVYAESKNPAIKRFRYIYYRFYSMQRLRKLADMRHLVQSGKTDLWTALKQLFVVFRDKRKAATLGLQPLGGDLFGRETLYYIEQCALDNGSLLSCLYKLTWFYSKESKQWQRVNYGALNVEEFGSVYEGLLELTPAFTYPDFGTELIPSFGFPEDDKADDERRRSGSHYTPEELVQPLIKHSLDYLLTDRKKLIEDIIKQRKLTGNVHVTAREALVQEHIYNLKVCDVACGSGHILISAARRIAEIAAGIIEEEEQPNPLAYRKAKREAIRQCIYGVDKNPMAVELCKVALWLESHNPGDSLSFLDHHIKNGDAIVGLAAQEELERGIADEAFKPLLGDDKEVARTLLTNNKKEKANKAQGSLSFEHAAIDTEVRQLIADFNVFSNLKDIDADDYNVRKSVYKTFSQSKAVEHLKAAADLQVAQFFIPKTKENQPYLCTDAQFRQVLKEEISLQTPYVSRAVNVEHEQRKFFHWFLEFPEVFSSDGFDCILGNPPYLGGSYIGTNFSANYFNYLIFEYFPTGGRSDLIVYFLRRIFSVLKGHTCIISTNSIAQGDSRIGGLDLIINTLNGKINFAIKSLKWPGNAAVQVSILGLTKYLNTTAFNENQIVDYIDSYLMTGNSNENVTPFVIHSNNVISFKGSGLSGEGFILNAIKANELIELRSENNDVIFPYLSGKDLNNDYTTTATRYVINFFDWDFETAAKYKECFDILTEKVKPVRDELIKTSTQIHEYDYWKFWDKRLEYYEIIKNMNRVLVISRVSKTLAFAFVGTDQVYSDSVVIIAYSTFDKFAILQSCFHIEWVWKTCTTMKTDPVYISSRVLQTFPFPLNLLTTLEQRIGQIGLEYYAHRTQLMLNMQLGLTKTYNFFHIPKLVLIPSTDFELVDKDFKKKYEEDATKLKKHLDNTPGTCSYNEAIQGILRLRELHVQMDNAVLEAYGWAPSSLLPPGEAIELNHAFYEVDYLPEGDRTRYTIQPDARKEILKRLLELNHKIHGAEEEAALLTKDQDAKSKKAKKGKSKQVGPTLGFD